MTLILTILGAIADFLTTRHILAGGGAEANPAARGIMNAVGINGWAGIRVGAAILAWVLVWLSWPAWTLWLVVGLAWVGPVWNAWQIWGK